MLSAVKIPKVSSILVLDSEGGRIAVNYFDQVKGQDLKIQQALEKKLHEKTCKSSARIDAEILLFEGYLVVYKFNSDAYFYVLAPHDENELVVLSVLNAMEETMANLLRNQVSKKILMENLDLLLLTMDEIVDDGVIMETDSSMVTGRVAMKGADGGAQGGGMHHSPVEQTFSQALNTAKEQLVKSFQQR